MNFLSKKPPSGKKTKKLTILQHKIHNEMKTLLYPNKEKKLQTNIKEQKDLKRHRKREIQMYKHVKISSTSTVIKKMQTNSSVIPHQMAKNKKGNIKCGAAETVFECCLQIPSRTQLGLTGKVKMLT